VAPVGKPVVENETDCEEPDVRVAVMTLLIDCPRVTDLLPLWAREKLNEVVALGVVLHASGVYGELPAEL